jgi:WD40 repeat protein
VWDSKTCKRLGSLQGHQDWIIKTAISPNGRLIATSSTDRTVKVWDMYSMTKIADIPDQMSVGSPICFSADGTTLVSVNVDGSLQFNSITPVQPAAPVVAQVTSKKKRHGHA